MKKFETMQHCDFLVIGGGIIGLCIAARLKEIFGGSRVILLEKEPAIGKHASGRNSGVLHAGFYYSTHSLKARFTREGNRALTHFCKENGLRINECGKLVVAQKESDLETLDHLFEQGKLNGVELEKVSASQARSIEPLAKTMSGALFSPTTSSVDPLEVVNALMKKVEALGVDVRLGESYVRKHGDRIQTTRTCYKAPYVVNSAGLYADTIARQFGFSKKHRILPFIGLYLYSNQPKGTFRTHIYPAPDMRYPFLGIHFTQTVDGQTKIGPTAIPAFWREQYRGLQNFRWDE
ncbi:MAG: NAD(P)/FAD-dependent oxidoreductase, partial [Nitrospinaceae bacterium]